MNKRYISKLLMLVFILLSVGALVNSTTDTQIIMENNSVNNTLINVTYNTTNIFNESILRNTTSELITEKIHKIKNNKIIQLVDLGDSYNLTYTGRNLNLAIFRIITNKTTYFVGKSHIISKSFFDSNSHISLYDSLQPLEQITFTINNKATSKNKEETSTKKTTEKDEEKQKTKNKINTNSNNHSKEGIILINKSSKQYFLENETILNIDFEALAKEIIKKIPKEIIYVNSAIINSNNDKLSQLTRRTTTGIELTFNETADPGAYHLTINLFYENKSHIYNIPLVIQTSRLSDDQLKIYNLTYTASIITIPNSKNNTIKQTDKEISIQQSFILGQPIKWIKKTNKQTHNNVLLPKEAKTITIFDEKKHKISKKNIKIKSESDEISLNDFETLKHIEDLKKEKEKIKKERKKTSLFDDFGKTINNLIKETKITNQIFTLNTNLTSKTTNFSLNNNYTLILNSTGNYSIEYETEAPQKKEIITNNSFEVIVYSNVTMHYQNISVNATIPLNLQSNKNLTLYHWINGFKVNVMNDSRYKVKFKDLDNNGFYDFVEWIVPQLSTQLFEIGTGSGTGVGIAKVNRDMPNIIAKNKNFTVKLTVYNRGDKTINNLTLNETIPPNFVIQTTGGGMQTGQTISWTVAPLYPDETKTYSYIVQSPTTIQTANFSYQLWDNSTTSIAFLPPENNIAHTTNIATGTNGTASWTINSSSTGPINPTLITDYIAINGKEWWNYSWNYRIPLFVNNDGISDITNYTHYNINMSETLLTINKNIEELDLNSLRVIYFNSSNNSSVEIPFESFYGRQTAYANFQEGPGDVAGPPLDFSSGTLYSTGDTWGLSGAMDGWDRNITNLYATDDTASVTLQDVDPNNNMLYINGHTAVDATASGGYGIEFNLPSYIAENIEYAEFGLKWWYSRVDKLKQADELWIKGGITQPNGTRLLIGSTLDLGHLATQCPSGSPDSTNEIFAGDKPDTNKADYNIYKTEVTNLFPLGGHYYFDIGQRICSGSRSPQQQWDTWFDDISIKYNYNTKDMLIIKWLLNNTFTANENRTYFLYFDTLEHPKVAITYPSFSNDSTNATITQLPLQLLNQNFVWDNLTSTISGEINKIINGTINNSETGYEITEINLSLNITTAQYDTDNYKIEVVDFDSSYAFDLILLNNSMKVNTNYTYIVNVTNIGNQTIITGSTFSVDVPTEFTILDSSSGTINGQTITYTTSADILIGDSTQVNFSGKMSIGGGYTFTMSANSVDKKLTEIPNSIEQQYLMGINQNQKGGTKLISGVLGDIITDDGTYVQIAHKTWEDKMLTPMEEILVIGFNLSHLNIRGSDIQDITFRQNSCWSSAANCASAMDYAMTAKTKLFDGKTYTNFGNIISIPALTVDYHTDGTGIFNSTKTSGFTDESLDENDFMYIKIYTYGSPNNKANNGGYYLDYATLDVHYTTKSSTTNAFVRIFDDTNISFISREIPSITSSLHNITNSITIKNVFNDTAINITLTETVSNISCDDPTSPNFELFTNNVNKGTFGAVTVNTTTNNIVWSGLTLQKNEAVTVNYTVQTPTCGVETEFINAFNATVQWTDLLNNTYTDNNSQAIRIAAYNRAYVGYAMVENEITLQQSSPLLLEIESLGMRDLTSLSNVTMTYPSTCSIDGSSLTDNGIQNNSTREIYWENLGSLAIGSFKNLGFNITCNSSNNVQFSVLSIYSDIVGELNTTDNAQITVINISDYLTTTWSPSFIEPKGISTLTTQIQNPYSIGSMTSIEISPLIPTNWTKSPNSQTINSLSIGTSDSKQIIITTNETISPYTINSTISFIDPNGVLVQVNVSDDIMVASQPNLIVVREMTPIIPNDNTNVMVRFYIYNNGNDVARNITFIEQVNDSFNLNGGTVVSVLDGGSITGNNITWQVANLTATNYTSVRYIMSYAGTVSLPNITAYELAGDTVGLPYDFSSGSLNSTANSFGANEAYDGWDDSAGSPVFGLNEECIWNPQITGGQLVTQDDQQKWNSVGCAYGININISTEVYRAITNGGHLNISLDWTFNSDPFGKNKAKISDEEWIKGIWTSPTSGYHYLGTQLDTGHSGADPDVEIMVATDNPNTIINYGPALFSQEITSWIEGEGMYYLTLGHKVASGDKKVSGRAKFDNIDFSFTGSEFFNFKSNITYTDSLFENYSSTETQELGVGSNVGVYSFNLTQREFNISENFNNTLNSLSIGDEIATAKPHIIIDPTNNYVLADNNGTYTSGTKTILFSNNNISVGTTVSDWFVINSTIADYHILKAYTHSPNYYEQLFVVSYAGILNITSYIPSSTDIIYQGDSFNVTANSTAINRAVSDCTILAIPPGFAIINDSSSIHVGSILVGEQKTTTFNFTALNRGVSSAQLVGTCVAGAPGQEFAPINITYAHKINTVTLAHSELEIGDIIYNITVNSTNLAKNTHNMNSSINIYNINNVNQNFGPNNTEIITNYNVSTNQNVIAIFNNLGSGYSVPTTQATGNYTVVATVTPDNLDPLTMNSTLTLVEVITNSSLNSSTTLPGETLGLTVNISNGWSSAVTYEVTLDLTYQPTNKNYTSTWTLLPNNPSTKVIASTTTDLIKLNLTAPNNLTLARAGNYTLNISINYTDPNGILKHQMLNETITINETYNFSIDLIVPERAPLGLNSTFEINISNYGNGDLHNLNSTLFIRNSLGNNPGFNIYPANQKINISFNESNSTTFQVEVLSNAKVETYNATTQGIYNSFETNLTKEFNVTRDIFINTVKTEFSEYEVGDNIQYLNITLNSTTPNLVYYTSSQARIFNSTNNVQLFGPNSTETTTAYINPLTITSVYLTNQNNGYNIPLDISLGTYIIQSNVTSNNSVITFLNGTIDIVLINTSLDVSPNNIEYNETANLNISILNNFSNNINFTTHIDIYNNLSENKTQLWNISLIESTMLVQGKTTNSSIITLQPLNVTQIPQGNYTINTTFSYVDPNGISKTKQQTTNIQIKPFKNISAYTSLPTMSVGVSNPSSITITNEGNTNIVNMNTSLLIYNATGNLMNWVISPESDLSNLNFGTSLGKTFLVTVPTGTPVGNYSANFTIDYNGTTNRYLNISSTFVVSETIFVNLTASESELEAGDILTNLTANISNINILNTYNITTNIDIFNPLDNKVSWGPTPTDTRTTLNLGINESVLLNWSNSSNGYYIPQDAPLGYYTIQATTNITSDDLILTFIIVNPKFKLVTVSETTSTTINPLQIGNTTQLNITLDNGFSQPITVNITSFSVRNSNNKSYTTSWNINPNNTTLQIEGTTTNSTLINFTATNTAIDLPSDTYYFNGTYSYTDPNGRFKTKTFSNNVFISAYKKVNITIGAPNQIPSALNSTFTVNISNVGNVPLTGTNISFNIYNETWNQWPAYSVLDINFNDSNSTTFTIEIPGTTLLGINYTVNVTGDTTQHTTTTLLNFTIQKYLFVKDISLQYTEVEPGTTITMSSTLENNLFLTNISVVENVTILDGSLQEVSWTPTGTTNIAINNSNTTVSLTDITVPLNTSSENYSVQVNTTYGIQGTEFNSTTIRISTITSTINSSLFAIEINESTNISINLFNEWFSHNFINPNGISIYLVKVTNSTNTSVTTNWTWSSTSQTTNVSSRNSNTINFTVNTSQDLPSGYYYFHFKINYSDPNTGAIINKFTTQEVGFKVDNVDANFELATNIYEGQTVNVNTSLINIGSNTILNTNVSIYMIQGTTRYDYFSPNNWNITNLLKSTTDTTPVTLTIPLNLEPGEYNLTLNATFKDSLNIHREEIIQQTITIKPTIDIDILINEMEHPVVKSNQTVNIKIHTKDYAKNILSNVTINGSILTFDGRNISFNGITDSFGNINTTLLLNELEGGYYITVDANKIGLQTSSRHSVIIADDNKQILIVKDDNSNSQTTSPKDINDQEYVQAIQNISTINITSTVHTISIDGVPTVNTLNAYDGVVWTLGNSLNDLISFTNGEEGNISAYLQNGGGLIVETEGLTNDVFFSNTNNDILINITKTIIPTTTSRITSLIDDNFTIVETEYNHPLIDGMGGELERTITSYDAGIGSSFYKDRIQPNISQGSTSFATWNNYPGYSAGTYVDYRSKNQSKGFGDRIVYYPYSIDGLNSSSQNKTIINSIIWTMKKKIAVLPVCGNQQAELFGFDNSQQIPIDIFVKDFDGYDVLNLENGTTINVSVISSKDSFTQEFNINKTNNHYNTTISFNRTGTHTINVSAYKQGHELSFGYCTINVTEQIAPEVTLTNPQNNFNTTNISIQFNYTAKDIHSTINSCGLYINGIINQTNTTINETGSNSFSVNLTPGIYNWSVGCTDIYNNTNITANRTLNITEPITAYEFNIQTTDIQIEPSTIESENVSVNITIHNTGTRNANNVLIRTYLNESNTLIDETTITNFNIGANYTINTSFLTIQGLNTINVYIDPLNAFNETNRTNNSASNSLLIGSWMTYYGKISSNKSLGSASSNLFIWNVISHTGHIFATDSDAIISWYALQALTRNTTNGLSQEDLSELDISLNLTNISDNIVSRYGIDNSTAKITKNYTIYKNIIPYVPIQNSTNNSNFMTGILWDTSDDINGEYSGSEDIIFISAINKTGIGKYGIYDYEITIPAFLRSQTGSSNTINIYMELT